MFLSLKKRVGIPGVIAVIALVFAMMGGAYAASGGLTAKQKKEVKSIAKSFQGTGPAGPAGPQGPAGANGKDGGNGSNGKDGISPEGTNFSGSKTLGSVTCTEGGIEYKGATTNLACNGKKGANGTNGIDGTSVTNTVEPSGVNCKEGGTKFTVGAGSPTYACKGDPWTAGGTLPTNATETGAFAGAAATEEGWPGAPEGTSFYPIAFPIPTGTAPAAVIVKPGQDKTAEGCSKKVNALTGNLEGGVPAAGSGKLCVYVTGLSASFANLTLAISTVNPTETEISGTSTSGVALKVTCSVLEICPLQGVWAVTG